MAKELNHPMKGLINIQNNDNKCFLWSHVRHLNCVDKNSGDFSLKNSGRIVKEDKEVFKKFSYQVVDFPVSKKGYGKIEILNSIVLMCFLMKIK